MQFRETLIILPTLFMLGCGGSNGSTIPEDFLSAIVTGADESSTAFWECVFDNSDDPTAEQAMNTLTFWENGRGISGSGLLYDWTTTDQDRLEGTFDGIDRLFVLDELTFTDDNNEFSALNISTFNVGTLEEDTVNFNANCNRGENLLTAAALGGSSTDTTIDSTGNTTGTTLTNNNSGATTDSVTDTTSSNPTSNISVDTTDNTTGSATDTTSSNPTSSTTVDTTNTTTSGGTTSPPALDLSTVQWLHTDVSNWAVSASMDQVTVTSTQVCMPYDKANVWTPKTFASGGNTPLVGNPWVFIWNEDQQQWFGATWEWLRPGQICKAKSSVNGDHIKKSPYDASSGWQPTSGETLYFMVSGLARSGDRNIQARTAPVKVIWP